MVLYPYVASITFDGINRAVDAVGQIYAKGDTTFTTPLQAVDASGLPVELRSNSNALLPAFFVEGETAVNWKSGEWVFPLVTSEPQPGGQGEPGVSVTGVTASGDQMTVNLSDGSSTLPITLPTAPGGSNEGVAEYIQVEGPTRAALSATFAKVRRVEPGEDLAGALAAGGRVRIVGVHALTSQLIVPSNTVFDAEPGAALDISGMAAGSPSVVIVGSSAAAVPLAGDAVEGASTVAVISASGVAAGDYVKVSSSQPFGLTSQPRGEIVRVASVSTNTLTLEDPLCDTYPAASGGQIEKLTFAENITLDGINWVGGADTTKNTIGLDVQLARNLRMTNCSSKNVHTAAVYLTDVIQSSFSDCHFTDCRRAGFGYGFAFLYACQDVTVTNCTGSKLRHLVTVGGGTSRRGITRRLAVSNCTASQTDSSGFDCHPSAEYVSFIGCHVIGSANDGITMQSARFVIANCTIEGAGTYGILVQNLTMRGLDGVISNNVIHRAVTQGIAILINTTAAYMRWSGLAITGNIITDSGIGITCESSSTTYTEGLVIAGNTVRRCTTSRIVILRGTQGAVVQGNSLHGPGGGLEILRLFTALNTLVVGNHLDGAGTAGNGINLITSTGCVITGNQIRNGTGTGVIGDAGSTDGIYGDNRNSYTTKEAVTGTGWAKANNL